MKKMKNTTSWIVAVTLMLSVSIVKGQEYDDMYFTKKDRKKVSFEMEAESQAAKETLESFQNDQLDGQYSSKELNPDFLARYSSTKLGEGDEINYGVSSSYYPESDSSKQPVIINNYYGTNYNSPWANNTWAPSTYMGWNSWSGFNFQMTFGNSSFYPMVGYVNPWNDPFFYNWYGTSVYYDPWMANTLMYDPWFNPWAYNRRFWRNNMWGNPWYGGFNSYAIGYWDGYYTGAYYGAIGYAYRDVISSRQVVRGARYSRGGTVTGVSRSNYQANSSRRMVAQTTGNGRQDYSRSQNEYYSRSSRSSESNNRAYTRSSSGERVATTNSRAYQSSTQPAYTRSATNSRSYIDRSSSAGRSVDNSRSSSSSVYSNRSGSTSNSYGTTRRYSTNSSTGNSSSYSGNTSRSYNNSYNNTRSSSGSSYSSGSRSSSYSSGSRSSSSYSGGSRSSSSSSSSGGSRSSGGGSSRSSGGRSGG